MIIAVSLNSNFVRKTVMVDSAATIRDTLDANEVSYASAPIYMDGSPLPTVSLDKTFDDFGITSRCTLAAVAKHDNA